MNETAGSAELAFLARKTVMKRFDTLIGSSQDTGLG